MEADKIKYKTFVISVGYAEHASVGSLIIQHQEGFEHPRIAMLDFVDCVFSILPGEAHTEDAEEWIFKSMSRDMDEFGDDWDLLADEGWSVGIIPALLDGPIVFVHSLLNYGDMSCIEYTIFEMKKIRSFGLNHEEKS